MKTTIWFIILTIAIGSYTQAQELNKVIMDTIHDQEILIGHCTRAGLMEGDFGAIFSEEYSNYEADTHVVNKIVLLDRAGVEVLIVLGTWCHDSQEQLPRFYRVLDIIKFPETLVSVICVDGNKTGGDVDIAELDIVKVPTFIFYRDGEEIGRIIETPENSLEQDMFEILK